MGKNNRSKYMVNTILSSVLIIALLSSCAKSSEKVTVEIKGKKENENEKPAIESLEEVTWVEFDESVLMYRVDFDKFLRDKLKLSKNTLENEDVINLIEIIRKEIGEDFYSKDKNDNRLCNLEGKSVVINADLGRWINVIFFGSEEDPIEDTLMYEIQVGQNGKTETMSRSRRDNTSKVSKYYIVYSDDKEYTRSILLREDSQTYLSIGLHEKSSLSDSFSISFDTDIAKAKINLSEEEYDALYTIMSSYSESDNLYGFLSDNADLLNGYLDLIKESNAEYYEYLCNLINGYIEKAKVLKYE